MVPYHSPQPFDEGHGVGVAGGDDPVAHVDDLSLRAALVQDRSKGFVQIGPAQRPPHRQRLPG